MAEPSWTPPSALTSIPLLIQWLQCCLLFVPPTMIETRTLSRIRAAILPLCIYGIWACYSHPDYSFFKPVREMMHLNIGLSVGKYLGVLKSIEYGLCDEKEYAWMGYKWAYGQKLRCEKDTVPSSTSTSAIDDPVPASGGEGQQHGKNVTEVMWLGWRCMLTMRGIGWSWGIKGKRIPARHPSQNFLSSLVKRLFIFHLLTVLPYAYLQFYREFSLDSAAILRTNFRFAHSGPGDFISSAIVLLGRLSRVVALGMAICGSIELQFTYLTLFVYAFTAFWRVIIPESSNGIFGYMRPDPFRIEAWPSPTVRPWMASSITELWGNRWHPFFRRTFVAVGGRPLIAIANRLGFTSQIAISICAAIGAFLLSGFIHEHINDVSPWLPRDASYSSLTFFMLQALAIIIENLFKKLTGRKIRGTMGRIWTWSYVLTSGLLLTECWLERGFTDVLPPLAEWQWWRWIIPQAVTLPNLSKSRTYLLYAKK